MLVRIHGIKPGEDHRLNLFKAGQSLDRRIGVIRDRIADFCVPNVLHVGHEETNLAGAEFIDFHWLGSEHTNGLYFEG